jgi:hypothetical protein
MAKVLTDRELVKVIQRMIENRDIYCDNPKTHAWFLEKLGEVVGDHLGAECVGVDAPDLPARTTEEGHWAILFRPTESTPDDGGLFRDYDPDVSVREWFTGYGITDKAIPDEDPALRTFTYTRTQPCQVQYVYKVQARDRAAADEVYYNSPPEPEITVGDSIPYLDEGLEVDES